MKGSARKWSCSVTTHRLQLTVVFCSMDFPVKRLELPKRVTRHVVQMLQKYVDVDELINRLPTNTASITKHIRSTKGVINNVEIVHVLWPIGDSLNRFLFAPSLQSSPHLRTPLTAAHDGSSVADLPGRTIVCRYFSFPGDLRPCGFNAFDCVAIFGHHCKAQLTPPYQIHRHCLSFLHLFTFLSLHP